MQRTYKFIGASKSLAVVQRANQNQSDIRRQTSSIVYYRNTKFKRFDMAAFIQFCETGILSTLMYRSCMSKSIGPSRCYHSRLSVTTVGFDVGNCTYPQMRHAQRTVTKSVRLCQVLRRSRRRRRRRILIIR